MTYLSFSSSFFNLSFSLLGQPFARCLILWHWKYMKWESFISSCFIIFLLYLFLSHFLPLTLLLLELMSLMSPKFLWFFIKLSRVTFDFVHLSILLLKYFTSFLSSLFSFKRLVSQDIEVEQAFNCEEYGIDNKLSQKVDTCFLSTPQGLATFCNWSFDPCDELSLVLIYSLKSLLVSKA